MENVHKILKLDLKKRGENLSSLWKGVQRCCQIKFYKGIWESIETRSSGGFYKSIWLNSIQGKNTQNIKT